VENIAKFPALRKTLIRVILRAFAFGINYTSAKNQVLEKSFMQNCCDYLKFEAFGTDALLQQVIEMNT